MAYRMLGSTSEAEDAVQEAWIRLGRCDDRAIENLGGWLTTVVGRVCLDMLRSRRSRREEPLGTGAPEETAPGPELGGRPEADPEQQALMADSVGLAMLVVLETLDPAERLAFVLHDMFAVPFDEIAGVVDRTPAAARQLASRARRRVQGADPVPDPDLARKREVVNAFLAAARDGEFEALLTVLDPDVVVRSDTGAERCRCPGPGTGCGGRGPSGDDVRAVRTVVPAGPGRRGTGRHRDGRGPPFLGHDLHGGPGQDRRDVRDPRPVPPPRP